VKRPVLRPPRPGYPSAGLLGLLLGAAPIAARADVSVPPPPKPKKAVARARATRPATDKARVDALRFLLDDELRTRPAEDAPVPMPPLPGVPARPVRPIVVVAAPDKLPLRWTAPDGVRDAPTTTPDRPLDFVDEVLGDLERDGGK
jgi:hypothetical protein